MTRTAAQIRQEFIDFFRQKHGHVFVPSSPVVPHDDPTLLFTNAGMNQFKPYFLGTETPRHTRVANTQKCIRAGGKHNDLDDVGHDTYHHTFFEMLGNWSFGDYFKKEAIAWAWELLVDVWGIDPTRLHATYFGGDPPEGLEPDNEARDLWRQILPPERVHAGSKKDNFWEMGETGPCGPCSEIHIDLTPDKSGAKLVNAGDARAIEIWNLVFIQFNRAADGKLTPLPAKHVDTGMGFERVTAILQGHYNNYATDVFVPIIQAIEKISGHTYGLGGTGVSPVPGGTGVSPGGMGVSPVNRYAAFRTGDMRDESCRVIADHVRTLTFAITDGAVPDKEGRGYVLRRILRRAVRYGWQYLGLHEPFLHKLVPTVVELMGEAFPELRKHAGHVQDVVREEEESFDRTLDRGIRLFDEAEAVARVDASADGWTNAPPRHKPRIPAEVAFRLHDTYGFPIDLTEIMAREHGLDVDIAGYERLMEEARDRARSTRQVQVDWLDAKFMGKRDDQGTSFLGYDTLTTSDAEVSFVARSDGVRSSDGLQTGESGVLVLDKTPFYAEAGGQAGDKGVIRGACNAGCEPSPENTNWEFRVEETRRIGPTIIHHGTCVRGPIQPSYHTNTVSTVFAVTQALAADAVRWVTRATAEVTESVRRATMKNHTATHVMNWALREVLGDHVQQKGSLVDHEKTRFDFSHPKALTPEQVGRVEQLVNEKIRQNLPVHYKVVPQHDALKINGLRAVFGERYPDEVRVMSVGVPVEDLLAKPDNPEWRKYSIEFCGGTHLHSTGEIEHFAIITEEAVAKGVRRIVAVTGDTAQLTDEIGAALVQRAESLKAGPADAVPEGLAELQNTLASATIPLRHRHRLLEQLADLQAIAKEQHKSQAADAAEVVKRAVAELLEHAEKMGDTTVVIGEMPDVPIEQLKMGADQVKQKYNSAAVLFGVRVPSDDDGPAKALLLAAVTPDLVKKGLKAGDLVKAIAPIVGGGGGGPPTMAQAGGKQPEKIADALDAGRKWILERLTK